MLGDTGGFAAALSQLPNITGSSGQPPTFVLLHFRFFQNSLDLYLCSGIWWWACELIPRHTGWRLRGNLSSQQTNQDCMSSSLGEHLPLSEGERRRNRTVLYSCEFPPRDFFSGISASSYMTWRRVSGTENRGPLWLPHGKTCMDVSRTSSNMWGLFH